MIIVQVSPVPVVAESLDRESMSFLSVSRTSDVPHLSRRGSDKPVFLVWIVVSFICCERVFSRSCPLNVEPAKWGLVRPMEHIHVIDVPVNIEPFLLAADEFQYFRGWDTWTVNMRSTVGGKRQTGGEKIQTARRRKIGIREIVGQNATSGDDPRVRSSSRFISRGSP